MPIMRSAESWAPVQMDALMIKSLEVPDLLINNVPNVAAGHHSSLSVAAEAQSQLGADIGLEADGERVHLPSLAKNLLRRSTKFGESLCVAEDLQDDLATFHALAVIAPPPQFQGSSRLPGEIRSLIFLWNVLTRSALSARCRTRCSANHNTAIGSSFKHCGSGSGMPRFGWTQVRSPET